MNVLCQESVDPCKIHWNWRTANELSWKQSVSRTKNLSNDERQRLIAALTAQLRSVSGNTSEEELRSVAQKARVKYVDLDGDGKSEVIIQAAGDTTCSPTGNCSIWVLRRSKNRYQIILDEDAQTFTVQSESSHGFRDLLLTRHGSAFASDGELFRFDGQRYRLFKSFEVEWYSQAGDGSWDKRLDTPKLTNCRSEGE